MGYYSEVAIKLNKAAVAAMTEDVRQTLERNLPLERTWEDGSRLYHSGMVKWYEDFENVRKVMGFLHSLGESHETVSMDDNDTPRYEFMRIGEEDGDDEHDGNGEWWQMWIDRTIGWD
jgi:hypothetical protein